jgi:ABC-type multidrug transport system ATPase subunit
VADRARAARRRRDDLPDNAVPRGGQLAHTVGLLDGGHLVAEGTPAELKAQAGGETLDDVFLALTGHAATTGHDADNDDETEALR